MKAKLKVTTGKRAGKTIGLKQGSFLIGRSQEAFLRARSDTVSRRHCEIIVDRSSVAVQDLDSKNGTLVNGQRIQGRRELKAGDQLQVGPMRFEVLIEAQSVAQPSDETAEEAAVAAAPRQAPAKPAGEFEEEDISQWLDDETDAPEPGARAADSHSVPPSDDETRQVDVARPGPVPRSAPATAPDVDQSKKKAKREPSKLPPTSQSAAKDSGEAAGDVLRKLSRRK